MKNHFLYALILLTGMSVQAQTVLVGSNADTFLRDAVIRGENAFMDVRGGGVDFAGYLRFNLSGLSSAPLENAKLTLTVSGGASRNDVLNTVRFGLYGLNNVAGNTPQDWDEATLSETGSNPVGAEWNNVVPMLLEGRVTNLDMETVPGITETLNPSGGSAAAGTTITISGAPLVAFLQGRIDDGGLVTFILANNDGTDRGYGLASKENATEAYRPVLELTFVPEPATLALLGLGSLITLRKRHR